MRREHRKTKHEGGKSGKGPREYDQSVAVIQWQLVRYSTVVAIASRSDNGFVEGRQGKLLDQTKTTVNWAQHQDCPLVRPGSSTAGNGTELHLAVGLDAMSCLQFGVHLDRQHAGRVFVSSPLRKINAQSLMSPSTQPVLTVRLEYCNL